MNGNISHMKMMCKVKSLCLTKHYAMKAYGEWRYGPYAFLTPALDGSEYIALHHGCFTPGERAPCTCWMWGWVSPRASLSAVAKGKNTCSCWESNPGRLASSLGTILIAVPTHSRSVIQRKLLVFL